MAGVATFCTEYRLLFFPLSNANALYLGPTVRIFSCGKPEVKTAVILCLMRINVRVGPEDGSIIFFSVISVASL
jgi:hypothetical protein